jgi:SAM-dependent methyltransferase
MSLPPMASPPPWLRQFFDDRFADLVLDRDVHEVNDELDHLLALLEVTRGARILDQGCGIGTLAVPMAARGFKVVGVDLVASYIDRARLSASAESVTCDLHVADALDFTPSMPCDAAFCWRTSFGFHRDDRSNARQIEAAFRALRSGGRFALDVGNLPSILRNFQPCMMQRIDTDEGEILVIRESNLDLVEGSLHQTWTYFVPGGQRHVREGTTHLYLPHQLADMMRAAGFVDVRLMGDLRQPEREIWPDAPRCIVVGTRP